MSTPVVDQLVSLLDESFAGEDWHSLLTNLRSVTPEAWDWVPPRGHRSIRRIVQHVGGCKFMYENHAFGDATLSWDHPLVAGDEAVADMDYAVAWLREGHSRFRQSVSGLSDEELHQHRMTNWGEPKETHWIVMVMIQHDIYHSGEINHIRALYEKQDRWAYDEES